MEEVYSAIASVNGFALQTCDRTVSPSALLVLAEMTASIMEANRANIERCYSDMLIFGQGELRIDSQS